MCGVAGSAGGVAAWVTTAPAARGTGGGPPRARRATPRPLWRTVTLRGREVVVGEGGACRAAVGASPRPADSAALLVPASRAPAREKQSGAETRARASKRTVLFPTPQAGRAPRAPLPMPRPALTCSAPGAPHQSRVFHLAQSPPPPPGRRSRALGESPAAGSRPHGAPQRPRPTP